MPPPIVDDTFKARPDRSDGRKRKVSELLRYGAGVAESRMKGATSRRGSCADSVVLHVRTQHGTHKHCAHRHAGCFGRRNGVKPLRALCVTRHITSLRLLLSACKNPARRLRCRMHSPFCLMHNRYPVGYSLRRTIMHLYSQHGPAQGVNVGTMPQKAGSAIYIIKTRLSAYKNTGPVESGSVL